MVKQGLWRAAETVSDLMDFAGHEDGKRLEVIEIDGFVRDAIADLSAKIGPDIHLHVVLAAENVRVHGRHSQLRRMITNVVTNAVQALKQGKGTVTISTRLGPVSKDDVAACLTGCTQEFSTQAVMLEIVDDGVGMDSESVTRVFEPFYSTRGGRGLGMAGVLGIARLMGAGLTLSSQKALGTSVKIFFDSVDASELRSRQIQTSNGMLQNGGDAPLVLIVDDERDVLDVVSAQVESLGYPTIRAGSCDEAIAIQLENPAVALAVIDVAMPVKSGWETVRELRRSNPGLIIIMMSGFSKDDVQIDPDDRVSGEVLQKPFSMQDLERSISAALKGPVTS